MKSKIILIPIAFYLLMGCTNQYSSKLKINVLNKTLSLDLHTDSKKGDTIILISQINDSLIIHIENKDIYPIYFIASKEKLEFRSDFTGFDETLNLNYPTQIHSDRFVVKFFNKLNQEILTQHAFINYKHTIDMDSLYKIENKLKLKNYEDFLNFNKLQKSNGIIERGYDIFANLNLIEKGGEYKIKISFEIPSFEDPSLISIENIYDVDAFQLCLINEPKKYKNELKFPSKKVKLFKGCSCSNSIKFTRLH